MCHAKLKSYVLVIAGIFLVLLAFDYTSFAEAKETVLYSFGATSSDGAGPAGGLTFDGAGNMYGTTRFGGSNCPNIGGCGTVFELSPSPNGWTETVLYSFCMDYPTCTDGHEPFAGLVSDKAGNLFGTTPLGGSGFGTVFELSPPTAPGGNWKETVVWTFGGAQKGDGAAPLWGKLNWDSAGNLCGTTAAGGSHDKGAVFQVSPKPGGGWTEAILHSFNGTDGAGPAFGVAIDNSGNLYGTTQAGGVVNGSCSEGCGLVYQLRLSNGRWIEKVLYKFDYQNGANPFSPISIDQAGNLYGTFQDGGKTGSGCFDGTCGGAFKLVPEQGGGGTKYTYLFNGQNGGNPLSGVLVDNKTGIIFGTTWSPSTVYMIQGKKETVLYRFCSEPNCADGTAPVGGLLTPRGSKLYGVAQQGGTHNNSGVVFMISR